MIKRKVNILTALIFISILMLIIDSFYELNNNDKVVKTVNDIINIENTEELITINKVKELQNYYNNKDIIGTITIDSLDNFNYPIVQAKDNDYYLKHNYYKAYDSYGAIYADYRINLDTSKKILIYGHSSKKKDVPFNILENYYNEDYYNNNKYITLETSDNIYRYEIFSVYVETKDFTYMNINFDSKEEWFTHIQNLKNKSLYKTNIELNINDDILILQTCSKNSNYQKYSKKYLLIVSRRVK